MFEMQQPHVKIIIIDRAVREITIKVTMPFNNLVFICPVFILILLFVTKV